jgi:hypothetical protein
VKRIEREITDNKEMKGDKAKTSGRVFIQIRTAQQKEKGIRF